MKFQTLTTLPIACVLAGCTTTQATAEYDLSHYYYSNHSSNQPSVGINNPNFEKRLLSRASIIHSKQDSLEFAKYEDAAEFANTENDNPDDNKFRSTSSDYLKNGLASWYGPGFHGKKTAGGETFNMYDLTAAHRTLPISSYAQVTNLDNNRSVIVRINDRGPFHGHRLMDLSYAAAKKIGIQEKGTGRVQIRAIDRLHQAAINSAKNSHKPHKKVYLQVAKFGSASKAISLQGQLAAHHLANSTIVAAPHNNSISYKVELGPINSSSKAQQLTMQLSQLGITHPHFVTETRQN